MGVCLEVCLGHIWDDMRPIFRVSQSFDMDKEFSPIYNELFELEGEELAAISYRHGENLIKESGYGDKFKLLTIGQFLKVILDVNNVHKLTKPETLYKLDGSEGMTSRWEDKRVQGLIAYLKIQDKDDKLTFHWS